MQTANDTIGPRSICGKLEELKLSVSSVAQAEAALLKSKAERLSVLRREALHHGEAEAEKLDIRIHSITLEYKDQLAREQAVVDARSQRIQHAYHSSKASLANRIQAMKDRRIGQVQGKIMRNRQTRQQELEQAGDQHLKTPVRFY